MGKQILVYCWWEYKMVQTFLNNSLAVSQKVKHKLTMQPSNSTPREMTTRITYKDTYMNVHSSIIQNS